LLLLLFFWAKSPAKRQKKARAREKVENILSKEKNLGNLGCLFAFFQKKVERNLLIDEKRTHKTRRRVSVDDKIKIILTTTQ